MQRSIFEYPETLRGQITAMGANVLTTGLIVVQCGFAEDHGWFGNSGHSYGWWIANTGSYGGGSALFLKKGIGTAHRCRWRGHGSESILSIWLSIPRVHCEVTKILRSVLGPNGKTGKEVAGKFRSRGRDTV